MLALHPLYGGLARSGLLRAMCKAEYSSAQMPKYLPGDIFSPNLFYNKNTTIQKSIKLYVLNTVASLYSQQSNKGDPVAYLYERGY